MSEFDEPVGQEAGDEPGDAQPPVLGARIVIAAIMVASVIAVAAAWGFGQKTMCTTEAGPLSYPESQCDVIDRWAWGGVVAALIVGTAHVGFGRRFLPIKITVPATLLIAVLMLTGMTLVV